ncbi:MAG TPA: radical SAM protein [Flavobacteriales bacterium]|nr:radical SAM protein [Flavobacteriales bacterium]
MNQRTNNGNSAELKIEEKIGRVFRTKCQSLLLINPLQVDEDKIDYEIAKRKRYYMYPPYSLALLSARLQQYNYKVKILDLNFEVFDALHKKSEPIDESEIAFIWKEILSNTLLNFQPDMVGITCTFTMGHEMMLKTSSFIKEKKSDLPIVAGGVHVTNAPEIVLKECKSIDFVSLYESDLSFCKMINFINQKNSREKLSQIGTLIGGNYVAIDWRTPPSATDLNIIPDYGELDVSQYSNLGEIGTFRYWRPEDSLSSPILSNRGCRAKCSFCSVANFNGKGVRGRSVESVVDEIEHLSQEYGIQHITWLDDDLFFDPKRTYHLFDTIAKRNLGITWDASNGVIASAAVVHPELLDVASKSGCIGMYFGIESGSNQILREIHKPSGKKHFFQLGEIMENYPQIFTRGFLIIGFPNETLSQIKETIDLAVTMNLDWYTVQLLTPLPSTEIYNQMVDMDLIENGSLNTEGEGFTMFSVRESEKQRRRESQNKFKSSKLSNPLNLDLNTIPSKAELDDLWLFADYEVNYKKIFNEYNPIKLKKMQCFLKDISDRMTLEHPISNFFLSLVESKLGNFSEASKRKKLVVAYLSQSNYWDSRFKLLDISLDPLQQIPFP